MFGCFDVDVGAWWTFGGVMGDFVLIRERMC